MGYIGSNEGVHMDTCSNSTIPCEYLHWIQRNPFLMEKNYLVSVAVVVAV